MLLGSRIYATNDVRNLIVEYGCSLEPGYVLKSVTATVSPGAQSIVGTVTLDPEHVTAFVPVTCASVNENFTLNLQAADTSGQVFNDQIAIAVTSPGATAL